jgi:hypothetical protein|tara:strand:- start:521 stop:664 length:144 start_codon:yes stop_codon:yes gene_type:complete
VKSAYRRAVRVIRDWLFSAALPVPIRPEADENRQRLPDRRHEQTRAY